MRDNWFIASLFLTVTSCGGPSGSYQSDSDNCYGNCRPAGAPDFLILNFSGHCFEFLGLLPCDGNPEYLKTSGASVQVQNVIEHYGYTATQVYYADEFYDREYDQRKGFLHAFNDAEWVMENWISDFDNPTKIIVLGHSHGTVWAHALLFNLPEFPVDILIDLDGVSLGWESPIGLPVLNEGDDWWDVVENYNDSNPSRDWALPYWWYAADAWDIPGQSSPQDLEDIVPESVWLNIEVKALRTVEYPNDDANNHRPDGSTDNIWTKQSTEDHANVDEHPSDAMDFVAYQMNYLYPW
jgi:hypothetical protein